MQQRILAATTQPDPFPIHTNMGAAGRCWEEKVLPWGKESQTSSLPTQGVCFVWSCA